MATKCPSPLSPECRPQLGVVEQHQAVLEVMGGLSVSEVARHYGVARQSVHRWLRRYESGGIGTALASAPTLRHVLRPDLIHQLDVHATALGAFDDVVILDIRHELGLLELVATVLASEVGNIHRGPPVHLLRVFHH
jgi:transposase-like protein